MELNKVFSKYFKPVSLESSKVNTELCKGCGGLCCKAMGCHISPFDLKEISVLLIISLIDESDCISIDWWSGNPITNEQDGTNTYFLRIKNKNSKVIDPSFGGECSILTDIGCSLSFEYRPKGARELKPVEGECIIGYSKQQCAIDWYDYQDVLEAVYNHYLIKGDVVDSPFMFMSLIEDLRKSLIEENIIEDE